MQICLDFCTDLLNAHKNHIKCGGGLVKSECISLDNLSLKSCATFPGPGAGFVSAVAVAGQVFCKTIRHFNCFNLSLVVKVYQLLFFALTLVVTFAMLG